MKYLALDIGNVLCAIDMRIFTNALIKHGYFNDFDGAWKFCEQQQHSLDLGHSTVISGIKENLGNKHVKQLYNAWLDIVIPIQEIDNMLCDVLNNGHNIALLSNMGVDHKPYINHMLPKSHSKCYKHISCDIGHRKPSDEFFTKFIETNPKYNNGIYIDDRLENLETSKKYFKNNIHFAIDLHDNHNGAINKFKQILVSEKYL